jgi:hypothetical protein
VFLPFAYGEGLTGTGPIAGCGFTLCGGMFLAAVSVSRVRLTGNTTSATTMANTTATEPTRIKARLYRFRRMINDERPLLRSRFLLRSQKESPAGRAGLVRLHCMKYRRGLFRRRHWNSESHLSVPLTAGTSPHHDAPARAAVRVTGREGAATRSRRGLLDREILRLLLDLPPQAPVARSR